MVKIIIILIIEKWIVIQTKEKTVLEKTLKQNDEARIKSILKPDRGIYWIEIIKGISVKELLKELKNKITIIRTIPAYIKLNTKGDTSRFIMSDEFHVKFFPHVSRSEIEKMNIKYHVEIQKSNIYNEYLFRITEKSQFNSLELANLYYESNLTIWSLPNFLADIRREEINDPLFSNQWHLENTGQGGGVVGIDISVIQAWDITTGSSDLILAVIDDGVENHEDFLNGQIITGYNPGIRNDPSPRDGEDMHGQCVTGIAVSNHNDIGSRGICKNIKIMPIHIFDLDVEDEEIADAIDWAWSNGAHILNNSWGFGTQGIWFDNIAEAINRAHTLGRNGKGCLVVKSAGNNGSFVTFPGTVPGVLVVGAVTNLNNPADYTPPDAEVDVVAPSRGGTLGITTIDRMGIEGYNTSSTGHYYNNFGGTSAAAPQVSGIGALILSLDPDLDARPIGTNPDPEVQDIIKTTAGDYGDTDWDGYGRINASQAIAHTLVSDNKSLDQTATAFNGGRRIVRDLANNYHIVFSSGKAIYYRKKNQNSEWEEPILLSDGDGNNYPCITLHNTGDIYVVWQRETSTGAYDIHFAMSWDNGTNWYSQDKYVLTTINANKDPLPVIQADFNGNRKMVVFYTTQGLKSYRTIFKYPYLINWYEKSVTGTTSNEFWPTIADEVYYGNVENVLAYTYNRAAIYYRYYAGGAWSNAINLSSIIPGSRLLHETPSISAHPSGSMIHVAWHMYDGVKHKIIHRKAYSYNNWPSVYYTTYYEKQSRPSISAMAGNNVNLIFQMNNQNSIYKMNYNGSYWSLPTYVADGQYPSILTGSTSAKYVWTQGYTPPYEVKLSSEILTKSGTNPDEKYYSRSIAWLDSSGAFFELQLNKMKIKMNDGAENFLPFIDTSLDSNTLTTSNSWNFLSSELNTISANVESLIVDYTYEAVNMEKLVSAKNEIGKINIKLLDKDNFLILNSSLQQLNTIGNISRKKGKFKMALNQVIFTPGMQFKINLNVENLKSKPGIFASLGHIFDFTGIPKENIDNSFSVTKDDRTILKAYPNPFNPITTITFAIPEQSNVFLKVYDIQGRVVAKLFNGKKDVGRYTAQFDGSNLSSGIYFYEIISTPLNKSGKPFRKVNKIILVK